MSKATKTTKTLPNEALNQVKKLGKDLQIARKRRGMTQKKLADLVHASRRTIQRIEQGDPTVSVGLIAHVLWVFHISSLDALADPNRDEHGLAMSMENLPERVGKKDDRYEF